MSDNTPFSGFGGGNALMPSRPATPAVPPVPPVPTMPGVPNAPMPPQRHAFRTSHARAALANTPQAEMIKKRDNAGKELDKLAEVANDPDPNRADIAAYIGKLTRTGQVSPDEAAQIMQGLPEQPDGIRQWARHMWNAMFQTSIHLHAAYPSEVFPGEGEATQQPQQAAEPPETDSQPEGAQ